MDEGFKGRGTLGTAERELVELTENARLRRVARFVARPASAVVLALVAFGVLTMATMLWWWCIALGVLVLAIVPLGLSRFVDGRRWLHFIAVAPVAVVVAVMALLGANAVWASARLPRPSIEIGLVVAAVVVTAVVYAYLRWVGTPEPEHALSWGAYAGLAAFALLWLTSGQLPDLKRAVTALAIGAATWLYLQRAAGPHIRRPLRWALLLAVATVFVAPVLAEAVQGGHAAPTLLIATALAIACIGIYELGATRGPQERKRSRRLTGAYLVAGVTLPMLILAFAALAPEPAPSRAHPLPAAAPAGPLPAIVHEHRPIVLFDSGEEFRTPVDVERMLATGHVELCPEGRGLLADCRSVTRVGDLRNGFGNLRLDTQRIEDANLPTTIYAQVVPDRLNPGWTDIDYWWFLPDNPANTGQGAMCGAGFVIPEITCFDHQADWEGVTVVLDEDHEPRAVHYAGHKFIIRVPWPSLQAALRSDRLRPYVKGRDVARRPLVFVARGTHAAYPLPCSSSTCEGGSVFEDTRHDGKHEWDCRGTGCVTPFPVLARGDGRASWNAFDGRWGSAVCIANIYCARTNGPESPGKQARYKRPWCYNREVRGDNLRRPAAAKPADCSKPLQTDATRKPAIARRERK